VDIFYIALWAAIAVAGLWGAAPMLRDGWDEDVNSSSEMLREHRSDECNVRSANLRFNDLQMNASRTI